MNAHPLNEEPQVRLLKEAYARWAQEPPRTMFIARGDAYLLATMCQFMTRDPRAVGWMRDAYEGLGRQFQDIASDTPEVRQLLEYGWHPEHDVDQNGRPFQAPAEEQPATPADATAGDQLHTVEGGYPINPPTAAPVPPTAGDQLLPEPYVYRVDRPAPHRPEPEFMMSYGSSEKSPDPTLRTVEQVATWHADRARIAHSYRGPMSVRIWAHRGQLEHYREGPPADAYCLRLEHQEESAPQMFRQSGPAGPTPGTVREFLTGGDE